MVIDKNGVNKMSEFKTYIVNAQIGTTRNSVSYHDGIKKHKDGSIFFDIAIFKRKTDLNNFIKKLKNEGYSQG